MTQTAMGAHRRGRREGGARRSPESEPKQPLPGMCMTVIDIMVCLCMSGGTGLVLTPVVCRHHLGATLEKNVSHINIPVTERDSSSSSADPMFHKMSQAFDEGGAKGMLMVNLVSKGGGGGLCVPSP